MGAWSDALDKLRAFAAPRGTTPAGQPIITNRDASGLLLFARASAAWARDHGMPSAEFGDWYPFALSALGWEKTGDKFVMTDAQQQAAYPRATELWHALQVITAQFDEASVPLDVAKIGSPMGSDGTYRQLARDAWDVMKGHDEPAAQAARPNVPTRPAGDDVEAAAKKKKKDSGGGAGALIFLALLLLADDKPRKRARW